MIKHILSIIFLAACLFCPTQRVVAAPAVEIIEIDVLPINISVNGSSLRVTGVRVMSLKVDGSDKTYNLNLPQGCYIVKVGDVVRKISVR